ncbi:MAG: hypothetical protein HOV94_38975 [Saccharothrix sp.]|nr:hypothetical protein [Saccharothrix sp.]
MVASADLSRRVLMISGAIDARDHDVAVSFELPEAGRWQVVKSETNLTGAPWLTWQMTAGEGTRFADGADALVVSRQFAKAFVTPDRGRLAFYDGEVRPGEAVLKMFSIDCAEPRGRATHARFSPPPAASATRTRSLVDEYVAHGLPPKPVVDVVIPVTLIG